MCVILVPILVFSATLRSTRGFQHNIAKFLIILAVVFCGYAIVVDTIATALSAFKYDAIPAGIKTIFYKIDMFSPTVFYTGFGIFAFFSLNVYNFAPVRV
jgi:hypothetical protein